MAREEKRDAFLLKGFELTDERVGMRSTAHDRMTFRAHHVNVGRLEVGEEKFISVAVRADIDPDAFKNMFAQTQHLGRRGERRVEVGTVGFRKAGHDAFG